MGMMEVFKKLLGQSNEAEVRRLQKIADQVLAREAEYRALTDEQLQAKTSEFKDRLAKGETLDDLLPRLDSLWEAGDHTAALKTLLEVRPVVDAFFDGVMVMCDDAALRANRLAMLNALGTRFARLADFAALQI